MIDLAEAERLLEVALAAVRELLESPACGQRTPQTGHLVDVRGLSCCICHENIDFDGVPLR